MFGLGKEQKAELTIECKEVGNDLVVHIQGWFSERLLYQLIKMLITKLSQESGKTKCEITLDLANDFFQEIIE